MIKKNLLMLCVLLLASGLTFAQKKDKKQDGFEFTPIIDLKTLDVEDQYRSGTCWAFSSLSFIESEMIRMGYPAVDLSEMFVVWHCYSDKADRYVRMQGSSNFGGGGAFHDALWVLKNYGMVPESVYSGNTIGEDKPVHGEMDETLKNLVSGVIKNRNKKLSPVWKQSFDATLNCYLGSIPEEFTYEGKKYTPKSFADEVVKINFDDYIEIGSYAHHPFYEKFILEVPDNWLWQQIYNVPINEMTEIVDNALANGYTVAWAADVSDRGFSRSKGIAVIPEVDVEDMSDSDIAKWGDMSDAEKEDVLYSLDGPGKEKTITQVMRQVDFDNYTTTDDHGLHIVGTAKDQNGTVYYKVKNSWGDYNLYHGYLYASKPYVALRTTSIMVHKDAVPLAIAKKMGLKK